MEHVQSIWFEIVISMYSTFFYGNMDLIFLNRQKNL